MQGAATNLKINSEAEMPELKPCPFCGGTKLHINTTHQSPGLCDTVRCQDENCGAEGPLGINEAEAIKYWNKRP